MNLPGLNINRLNATRLNYDCWQVFQFEEGRIDVNQTPYSRGDHKGYKVSLPVLNIGMLGNHLTPKFFVRSKREVVDLVNSFIVAYDRDRLRDWYDESRVKYDKVYRGV